MAGHTKGALVLVGLEAATGAGAAAAAAAAAAAPLVCFTMRGEAGSEAGPPYTAVPIRPAAGEQRVCYRQGHQEAALPLCNTGSSIERPSSMPYSRQPAQQPPM